MTVQLCLSVIGAVTGTIGAIIGILGILHNRFLAVNQYMEALEDVRFIEARTRIYNQAPNQPIPINNEYASIIVNFFHHWGLLAKNIIYPFGSLILGLEVELFDFMISQRDISWSEDKSTKTLLMRVILNGYTSNFSDEEYEKNGSTIMVSKFSSLGADAILGVKIGAHKSSVDDYCISLEPLSN